MTKDVACMFAVNQNLPFGLLLMSENMSVTDRLGSGGWTGNASQGGSIATADADNQQAGSIDKT